MKIFIDGVVYEGEAADIAAILAATKTATTVPLKPVENVIPPWARPVDPPTPLTTPRKRARRVKRRDPVTQSLNQTEPMGEWKFDPMTSLQDQYGRTVLNCLKDGGWVQYGELRERVTGLKQNGSGQVFEDAELRKVLQALTLSRQIVVRRTHHGEGISRFIYASPEEDATREKTTPRVWFHGSTILSRKL